jgi:hypothetical protein
MQKQTPSMSLGDVFCSTEEVCVEVHKRTLMPAYAKNLLPSSVLSRLLEGEAPTIELAVGYSKSNISPILKLFLSRLDELGPNQKH